MTDYVSQRGGADPVIYSLEPGDHTISFILREDGTRLDSFTLESVSVEAQSLSAPTAAEIKQRLQVEEGAMDNGITILLPMVVQ